MSTSRRVVGLAIGALALTGCGMHTAAPAGPGQVAVPVTGRSTTTSPTTTGPGPPTTQPSTTQPSTTNSLPTPTTTPASTSTTTTTKVPSGVSPVPTIPLPAVNRQDVKVNSKATKAAQAARMKAAPALAHIPYAGKGFNVEITAGTGHKVDLIVFSTTLAPAQEKAGYKAFLAKYHDPGTAYQVQFVTTAPGVTTTTPTTVPKTTKTTAKGKAKPPAKATTPTT